MLNTPSIAVAIFAHNVENTITDCILSIITSITDESISLFVLANGCSDSTEQKVEKLQQNHSNISIISIPQADKSNAWNHYVHLVAPNVKIHFFIDGDVTIQSDALQSIVNKISHSTGINAIGGIPIIGRDRQGWTQRMICYGRVSGGLYALQHAFLTKLREEGTKLPIGFIGEDFLVSLLAKNMLNTQGLITSSPKLFIDTNAGFSFQPLSKYRLKDYFTYLRRLVRYRTRDYQLNMLINFLENQKTKTMPINTHALYQATHPLPCYYWRGRYTLIDWFVVYKIKKTAKIEISNNAFKLNK